MTEAVSRSVVEAFYRAYAVRDARKGYGILRRQREMDDRRPWLAHFMRFRAGKVAENLSLLDSFDAVQQVIGRPLSVDDHRRPQVGNLVAV